MDLSDRPTKRARREQLTAIHTLVPYPREIVTWLMCMQRRGRSFPLWGQLHLRRNISACFLDPETGGPYTGYDFFKVDSASGRYRFGAYKSELEKVVIPSSVETIVDSSFLGQRILKDVTIPWSVTSIETLAFAYCFSLKKVVVPPTVTSIHPLAFLITTRMCIPYKDRFQCAACGEAYTKTDDLLDHFKGHYCK